jgi:hypothetical protein
MDEELKAQHAALKRKLAVMTENGVDEAKLNELKHELAALESAEDSLPATPRLLPSKSEPKAKDSPKTAEPRPQSKREPEKPASKAKDETKSR